ncbi:unnamed protein product [Protopolystoma xenopodis]|uniref:DUF4062 domain-containing protein n=1 Tax=Protopolystoma xenopodis TaxID=117903 RepID=A0A3S5BTQ5_9PLAT|nr:unnamed protein product [Protopolystoma xenopodis]
MHGERDLICGLIMPTLRKLAARELHVHLTEVDLRWGVPEPAMRSSLALRICLEQAASCDIFTLLLGERYGWVPKQALIDGLPPKLRSLILRFYKPGMSITEMEYRVALSTSLNVMNQVTGAKRAKNLNFAEAQKRRIFAFLRDPASVE